MLSARFLGISRELLEHQKWNCFREAQIASNRYIKRCHKWATIFSVSLRLFDVSPFPELVLSHSK